MKFRFIINTYPDIQACCDFLINQWQLSEPTRFYLQLYTEEYFTNLLKYTQHTNNSFGLQASLINRQLYLLFWDKTKPFDPKESVVNALGTRLLTQLFFYKYHTVKDVNFFWVKIGE